MERRALAISVVRARASRAMVGVALVAMLATSTPTPAGASAAQPTRYSLAKGCYSLARAGGGQPIAAGSRLRMQPTRLGSYLLYGVAGDFLAASGGTVAHAGQPGPASDWKVAGAGAGAFTLSPASDSASVMTSGGGTLALAPRQGAGAAARFRFVPATGCARFPESELDVRGKPAKGSTSYGEVQGLLDGHMHWMTFGYFGGNFHCGEPWDRYGITKALPDCAGIEGPQGAAAPFQNFLNYGNPVAPHDTSGYPKLTEWRRDNLTYEGTYYRWVERAYRAGLREIVMPVNENRELCQLVVSRRYSCDEMTTVFRGLRDIKRMQNYVDAQAGGPGKGFFQIVRNPFQARKVINRGKMAVVLEVEVSELFGCHGSDISSCGRSTIDQGLDRLYKAGVRSSLLLNKFDNPLTGVRFDGGPIGVLINAANRESYGSFWNAETCTGRKHDNTIESGVPEISAFLATLIAQLGVGAGTLPAYPPAPHCNTRGLTSLGAYTVRRMMDRGMIVNPDHMSQKAVADTLTIAEARRYSGVISPHGWMDPRNWPRIYKLGGMAFPGAGSAKGFVDAWKAYHPKRTPYYEGWGYGADLGGLAEQGEAAPEDSPNSVSYPFKSLDGRMTVSKLRTGDRVFDYAKEGVANYGLYPDWGEEVRKTGGPRIARDMLRGPEAYLQMWERAAGIRSSGCKSSQARFHARRLGKLRLGLEPKGELTSAGQPIHRARAWSYCVRGKRGRDAAQSAVLTPAGTAALLTSTARGNRALGIGPGVAARRLHGKAKPLGSGVWSAKLGRGTAVWVVRHGKVRMAAVARRRLVRHPSALRHYLALAPRSVHARPHRVIGGTRAKLSPEQAVPLVTKAGHTPFALYCGL